MKRNPKSRDEQQAEALPEGYLRPRDFEYVQPLYDLAFLLEIDALANKKEIPKYRTFSLWRAGYNLDSYATTIDRWLDGACRDADLDYVPSTRIKEYLKNIRKTGTLPELKLYRSEPYARCLRLRSIRGLGPKQIATSLSQQNVSPEWLASHAAGQTPRLCRLEESWHGTSHGPWQSAHIVPPLLRFLNTIQHCHGTSLPWQISGISDPLEAVNAPVKAMTSLSPEALKIEVERALRRETFFRRARPEGPGIIRIKHQMGWSFQVESAAAGNSGQRINELAKKLDPFTGPYTSGIVSDLHLHTAWSDGSASVNTMAQAVIASGLQYFAVTDHSRSSKLQGGLTPVLWLRQANALALASPVCPVLHGIEVDILKDGSLDLPRSLLSAADLVVASVHSSWSENTEENTDRLMAAIESGGVDILAHPTSALVGKPGVPNYLRPPASVDWKAVLSTCARWHVAVEINCFPSRLDLPVPLLREAVKAGCPISLGSDAHARAHLRNLHFGEAALRHVEHAFVLNRLPHDKLTQWVKKSREHRRTLHKSLKLPQQPDLLLEFSPQASSKLTKAQILPPHRIPVGSRTVGIDLTAGDKPTGIALLEGLHVQTCSLITDEEILSFVSDKHPSFVSIDSPLGLPGGGESIDPGAGIMRVAEHDLASIGIPAYPSLIDSMKNLTLRGISLRAAIEALPQAPTVIESYPGAAQDILCIPRKQKSLDLLREGLSRLGLLGTGLQTHSHDEMDAITSSIVARYYESGSFEPMGIPSEAQLIVPRIAPLSFEHNPVICLAGRTGAGKSVVARYLSVFYGFRWVRTRNLIRDLLIEDQSRPPKSRLLRRTLDAHSITEKDLQDFGAIVLNEYNQTPLRKHLSLLLEQSTTPVVIDAIRDTNDVDKRHHTEKPILVWFVECSDSAIRHRLSHTKKLGEIRERIPSPVDRNIPALYSNADKLIQNSGSLEDLRWKVDDALFEHLDISI